VSGLPTLTSERAEAPSHSARQAGLTLVELLVVISISAVVMTMLVMSWLTLTKSYSQTTRTTEAGELVRDAVSRISREIRDAEPDPVSGYSAIVAFDSTYIEFTTTFNQANNDQPLPTPVLTKYEYVLDATTGEQTLYRRRDTDGDGAYDRNDVVVTDLRNYTKTVDGWVLTTKPFICFRLNDVTRVPEVATADTHPSQIALVQVHLLVQMPGRGPKPSDLMTTVQLRNQIQ